MDRRTGWRVVAIILTAVSGVLGSIAYQAQHATSIQSAISGVAKGAQDRIRTARLSLDSLAAADTAADASSAAHTLRFAVPDELRIGQALELAARDGYGQAYAATWSSSDTNVLRVDAAGRVEAVGAGRATITAETRGGLLVRTTLVVPPD